MSSKTPPRSSSESSDNSYWSDSSIESSSPWLRRGRKRSAPFPPNHAVKKARDEYSAGPSSGCSGHNSGGPRLSRHAKKDGHTKADRSTTADRSTKANRRTKVDHAKQARRGAHYYPPPTPTTDARGYHLPGFVACPHQNLAREARYLHTPQLYEHFMPTQPMPSARWFANEPAPPALMQPPAPPAMRQLPAPPLPPVRFYMPRNPDASNNNDDPGCPVSIYGEYME